MPESALDADLTVRPFASVLIANRGEIALRIVRACRDAGLTSVAVYAEPDAGAPYVRAADTAIALDGTTAAQTYLDIDVLLAAAKESGAEAVHPGYGFLAENGDFAQAVLDAGLVWIGPSPQVIRDLGDKVTARAIAARAGAPLVAGTPGPVPDAAAVEAFADEHGLPLAIKAAFGGGGRGLRVVRDRADIGELFAAAVREATAAFGRGECFVEQFVEHGRHVEAQVLADTHGNVVVVGTRDCTVQRRHQKLIEEAPAPLLTSDQEAELRASSAEICRVAGYVGAGTVEFLLSPQGKLSFLEVNTRLQVEHSVTEETTDTDLVLEQFWIAAGGELPAAEVRPTRHALEFRINAEDPDRNFLPATGTVELFAPPSGPGIRLDSGIETGSVVGGNFDSLLAKLIVVGADRAQALRRARRALAEFRIDGVATTLPLLRRVIDDPAFSEEFRVHTRWLEQDFLPAQPVAETAHQPSQITVTIGRRALVVDVPGLRAADRERLAVERAEERSPDEVLTPMQGTVVSLSVTDGDLVEAGAVLAVVEAMKMENAVTAPHAGRVEGLAVAVSGSVAQGALVCRVVAA